MGRLVLIDALPATGVPGKLAIIEVDPPESEGPQGGFDAHSMHPSSVFASLQALGGTLPRTFVVGGTCEIDRRRNRIECGDA